MENSNRQVSVPSRQRAVFEALAKESMGVKSWQDCVRDMIDSGLTKLLAERADLARLCNVDPATAGPAPITEAARSALAGLRRPRARPRCWCCSGRASSPLKPGAT